MSSFPTIDGTEIDDVTTANRLVLLDFWQATCAPCRALEPRVERFAADHPGRFTGYRIDVDTDLDTATEYGVMSVPTVLLLRDGREVARLDGLIRAQDLEAALRDATE